MFYSYLCWVVVSGIIPNNIPNKVFFTKYLITNLTQIRLFSIINGNKDNPVIPQ